MIQRATANLRNDFRYHLTGVLTLVVAVLCMATSVWAVHNLQVFTDAWAETRTVTLYLKDDLADAQVDALKTRLLRATGVSAVKVVPPDKVRERLSTQIDSEILGALPDTVMPRVAQVHFDYGANADELAQVERRVRALPGVVDVDTHRPWLAQVARVGGLARYFAFGLAILVMVCVFAVISHSVRATAVRRNDEMEVQRLFGATEAFVRGPIVLEAALLTLLATMCALGVLNVAYLSTRAELTPVLEAVVGVGVRPLPLVWQGALSLSVTLTAVVASLWVLRRPTSGRTGTAHGLALALIALLVAVPGRAEPGPDPLSTTKILRTMYRDIHHTRQIHAHDPDRMLRLHTLRRALLGVEPGDTPPDVLSEPEQLLPIPTAAADFASMRGDLALPVSGASDIQEELLDGEAGLRFAVASRTWVRAAAQGTVVFAGKKRPSETPTVIVGHAGGYFTVYQGVTNTAVVSGEKLDRGAQLGVTGDTGLRFEVREGTRAVDALSWLGL